MFHARYQHCPSGIIATLLVLVFPLHQHAQNLDDQNRNNKPGHYAASHANSKQKTNNADKESYQANIFLTRNSPVLLNKLSEKIKSRQINNYFKDVDQETLTSHSTSLGNENGNSNRTNLQNRRQRGLQREEIDHAVEYGLKEMRNLYTVKEPELYKLGVFLKADHPAYSLAYFRSPNEKALNYARYGYAAVQARKKLAEMFIDSREFSTSSSTFRSELFLEECPLQGSPTCFRGFKRYRTADGTCNNLKNRWRGASMLPMQRFLAPHYEDGIQAIRRSASGASLPSARDISSTVHRDSYRETPMITMMFMQWGQFLDHDIISSAQSRMFNRSVPQCCADGGRGPLPPDLTHPECLPIPVSDNDWFLSRFGIRCIEFVRSAPTSRIDCDLGWREQINQATAYIDASTLYGSDPETADSLRVFRKGQLIYGRSRGRGPLQPPDPPEGELCRLGAVTTDCFRGGDFRVGDQPGLTAVHTIWLRYHNRVANALANINPHWKDEKLFQEARRIIGALVQHITYKEFLPVVLGRDVITLFELKLERDGYYTGYNHKVNPAPANAFGTAAFRFGHSLVQSSLIRTDSKHRIIRNNVTLHNEQQNAENIWSFGSVDRLLLGLCNQPIQKRDEFISDELTNHLFQTPNFPFGMDLAAMNIQRGRDHGIPSYTAWREPCGLKPLRNWTDLEKVMSPETVRRFRLLYEHFDDIDLFSGGLAEKPVRGGIVGPTFACIIAQQFSNLRKGDRFWYENGNFRSSFTPAQLQQIRKVTFAHVLCKTTSEVETLQPFVFLSPDNSRNQRVTCDDPMINSFDLDVWKEDPVENSNFNLFSLKASSDQTDDFISYDDDDDSTFTDDYNDHLDTTNQRHAGSRDYKINTHPQKHFTDNKTRLTIIPNSYINIGTTDNTYKLYNLNLTDGAEAKPGQAGLTNNTFLTTANILTDTHCDTTTKKIISTTEHFQKFSTLNVNNFISSKFTKNPYRVYNDKNFFTNVERLDKRGNFYNDRQYTDSTNKKRLGIITTYNNQNNYDYTKQPGDKQEPLTIPTVKQPTTYETKFATTKKLNLNKRNNFYNILTRPTITPTYINSNTDDQDDLDKNLYGLTIPTTDSYMTKDVGNSEKTTSSLSKTKQTEYSKAATLRQEMIAHSKSDTSKLKEVKEKSNSLLYNLNRTSKGFRTRQIEDVSNPFIIFDVMNFQNEEFSTNELPKPMTFNTGNTTGVP